MPPAMGVFGTMAVSTTFIEGVRFMEPEYSPACLAFSPLARTTIRLVLVLRGSVPLGCGPGNRSSSGWSNRPADRRLRHFRAFPCRSDSGAASRRRDPACCRDHDFRHRRLIFPIPIGPAEAVGDLRPGERPSAPEKMFQAGLRRGSRGRRWRVSRSRESQGESGESLAKAAPGVNTDTIDMVATPNVLFPLPPGAPESTDRTPGAALCILRIR